MTQDELVAMFRPENAEAMRAEELDPELETYFEQEGGSLGWPMIRHPLVYEVPYSGLPGLANRRLKAKREAVDKSLAVGNVEHAIWLHERPWRLWAFLNLVVGIDPDAFEPEACPSLWSMSDDARMLATRIWSDSENISAYQKWWEALWSPEDPERKVLPGGYREVIADEEGRRMLDALPEEFTVFKGGDPSGDSSLSWTTDYETAEFFARRVSGNQKPRKVISRRLTRSEVFAAIGDRGEHELLALPQQMP